jgi:hypothetical protein
VQNSTASFNGSPRSVVFLSDTQLIIALNATDLATAGSFPVVVTNPAPGGGTSNGVPFTVSP